jgi:HEAT repeat protein/lysophospholipase L1-like esterase
MSPRRALLLNVLLSLTVTLVFAGLLEGVCRLYEKRHSRPAVEDYIWDWKEKWQGDFYTIRSEVNGWPPWQEFNADGLRDRSHPLEAPAGTTRVVFLGDSVTLGDQIRPEEAYPQQLQARYDAEGRPIEVFNVALWGWSTRQERRAFREIARKYEPQQVILAVCLNDLPELQNNLTQPPGWLAALHLRSALVRRVVNAQGREIQSVEQLFSDPTAPRVHEAFRRFFDEVRALRAEVQATGAGFGMMVFPFRFQVGPGAPPPVVQSRIAEFCGREALPCLDLLPALRRLGEAAYVDYDHLNPAGMALVTGELAMSKLMPEVAAAASRLGGRASFESARANLLDPEPEVRAAAAWALGRARQKEGALEAEPLLFALLDDAHEGVRHAAARGLDGQPALSPATRDRLFRSLDDPSEPVRWAAARALATSAPTVEDVPRLAQALGSADPYVRGFGAFCLGEIGPPAAPAVPALIAALKAEDGYDRGGAASALARIGPAASAAVPALLEGLRSADGDRRWKAARILGRIGAPATEAVPDLVRALRDPNEYVRAHAAKALGRIGRGGADVTAALAEATRDPDEAVRREADAALVALRRKTGA